MAAHALALLAPDRGDLALVGLGQKREGQGGARGEGHEIEAHLLHLPGATVPESYLGARRALSRSPTGRRCYDGLVNIGFRAQRVRMAALFAGAFLLAIAGCVHRALRAGKDAGAADLSPTDAAQDVTSLHDSPSAPDTSPDSPIASAADAGLPEACEPVGCSRNGTDYCGEICDGCGGHITCPTACGPGRTCDVARGICTASACVPMRSCVNGDGNRYCGFIGDGCGGLLRCGECPEGQTCKEGLCTGRATCRAWTCTMGPPQMIQRFCGTIDDCCGGTLQCGECGPGLYCLDHLCSNPTADFPLRCQMDGYRFCGSMGDGLGRRLDCSECAEGWTCRNHLCVALPGRCSPVTCEAAGRHRFCSTIGDGCGGTLQCGVCLAGEECGFTHNCVSSTCDGGCPNVDPHPPESPQDPPSPPVPYQCPVPSPVIEAPTPPPLCP
jgi:hypothetical protein